jgi:hypothetical protein
MIGRGQREGVAAEFLRDVLAGGPLGVPKLEAMARTAGLLGEGQRITHANIPSVAGRARVYRNCHMTRCLRYSNCESTPQQAA